MSRDSLLPSLPRSVFNFPIWEVDSNSFRTSMPVVSDTPRISAGLYRSRAGGGEEDYGERSDCKKITMNPVSQQILHAVDEIVPFTGRSSGGGTGLVTGAEVLVLGARTSEGSSKRFVVNLLAKMSSEAVISWCVI